MGSDFTEERQTAKAVTPSRLIRACLALVVFLITLLPNASRAQEPDGPEDAFPMSSAPYLPFSSTPPRQYNIKVGNLTARFQGTVRMEYNDNLVLADENPEGDLLVGPGFDVGFVYLINRDHTVQLDLGMGYRWYMNNPDAASITIDPSTQFSYKILASRFVDVTFYDAVAVRADPLFRGDLAGSSGDVLEFRRVENRAGVAVNWQVTRGMTFSSHYAYGIDRSMSGEFESLDADVHTFNAAMGYKLSDRWTVRLQGGYTVREYLAPVHNDGITSSAGPALEFKPSKRTTVTLALSYTAAEFEQSAEVEDGSDFFGVTFALSVHDQFHRRISHRLDVARTVTPGFGGNFMVVDAVQYGLSTKLTSQIAINPVIAYEHLDLSGAIGERADRLIFTIGTGLQISRAWTATLGYAMAFRASNRENRDYFQNRVSLTLVRRF